MKRDLTLKRRTVGSITKYYECSGCFYTSRHNTSTCPICGKKMIYVNAGRDNNESKKESK